MYIYVQYICVCVCAFVYILWYTIIHINTCSLWLCYIYAYRLYREDRRVRRLIGTSVGGSCAEVDLMCQAVYIDGTGAHLSGDVDALT